jgi:serine/threonine-protein kinase
VPNVVGLTLDAAAAQLNGAGFHNLPYDYNCYGSSKHGTVVTQTPSGGSVDPSTPIVLKLEADDCRIVPNVLGLDFDAAVGRLQGLGFTNIPWRYTCEFPGTIGTVTRQTPGAGPDIVLSNPVEILLRANDC